MSTFLCSKCGAVENTATSDYWLDVLTGNKPICSKCRTGKWHDKFPRRHWSYFGIEKILSEQEKQNGNCINAIEHFEDIGLINNKQPVLKEIDWEE